MSVPKLKKLINHEQAICYLPEGAPSPPKETKFVGLTKPGKRIPLTVAKLSCASYKSSSLRFLLAAHTQFVVRNKGRNGAIENLEDKFTILLDSFL